MRGEAQQVGQGRFAQVPGWLVDDERVKPAVMDTYLRMALHLANFVDRKLSADRHELTVLTGRGKSQINEHLAVLREVGAIEDRDEGRTLYLPMEPTGNSGRTDRETRTDRPDEPVGTSTTEVGEELLEGPGAPAELPAVVKDSGYLESATALCVLFAEQLTARGYIVRAGGLSKRWLLDMEQLLRLDGRAAEDVERVLRWLDGGRDDVASFWRTNVRSPATLRVRWQTMREQHARLKRQAQPRSGGAALMERLGGAFPPDAQDPVVQPGALPRGGTDG